jgi:DNA-binding CsgD family transcriptional regulator
MRQLSVFYFFVTLLFGVGSLTITTVLYKKTKERLLQQYLIFYAVFTLVVVCTTAYWYINANLPDIDSMVMVVLNYVGTISVYLLMITFPAFMHVLCAVPHASLRNAIFAGIALVTFVGYNFFVYIIIQIRLGAYIESAIFISVMLYTLMAGFFYYRRLPDDDRKQAARNFLVPLLVFFPGIVLEEFVEIQIFPLLYCCYSIVFTRHFLKHYFHSAPAATSTPGAIPPQTAMQMTPTADLFAQHNISPREQEIIRLVLQGYSNQKIAETLFISLHTVKTHLRNIYPKFEVSSRYELITLFQRKNSM